MKLRDTRLWTLLIALAFALLWCISVGVTHSVPAQEPAVLPAEASTAPQIQAIGILGWILVGLGSLGVLLAVIPASQERRRRISRPVHFRKSYRSPQRNVKIIYGSPYIRQYRQNVVRRR